MTMDSVCAEPNLWMCSMASSMESTSSSVSANVPYSCLGLGAAGSPSARVLFSPPYMVMSAGAQEQQESVVASCSACPEGSLDSAACGWGAEE